MIGHCLVCVVCCESCARVQPGKAAAARFLDAIITNAYLIPRVEIPRESETKDVDTDVTQRGAVMVCSVE